MSSSSSAERPKKNLAHALLSVLFIATLAYLSIARLQPPDTVPADAPSGEFSSARAVKHLRAIAQKPRPVGTLEHARVRQYILDELTALGVAAEVQQTTAVSEWNPRGNRPVAAGIVHNIVARVPGTSNTKALLLMAHYDSVPSGAGATDDGAGVVALLETLRALKAQAPLKNDFIFLFTDGEELGLLGAKAFVSEHPAAGDVGLVLNFEGRGTRGPVMMFETSDRNGWLIREFARAAPHAVANSLMYAAYKSLPNDTDLSVFKRAGIPALNFAYIEGIHYYHTALDTPDETDERSVQHHGSYALALARHFGNLDLNDRREPDAVYFNVYGTLFVHYTRTWASLLSVFTALAFAVVVVYGFRTRQLRVRELAGGIAAVPCAAVLTAILLTLAWWTIRATHRGFDALPWGDPYNGHLYKIAFVCLTIAATSALYRLLRRKISVLNLAVGALCWWLLLLIWTTLALPAGSFLFTWPLLASTCGVAFALFAGDDGEASEGRRHDTRTNFVAWRRFAVHMLAAVPTVLLGAPLVSMLLSMLGVSMATMVLMMLVLLISLLVLQLDFVTAATGWLLPVASVLVGIGFIVAGLSTARFDARHRAVNSVFYALDADAGHAIWGSFDRAPDEWTSQFIQADAARQSLDTFFPWISRPAAQTPAHISTPPAPPQLEVLEDFTRDGGRIVRARVASTRQAALVLVFVDASAEVLSAAVNGKEILRSKAASQTPPREPAETGGSLKLLFAAPPPEGFELALEVRRTAQPLKLFVEDVSYELPNTHDQSHKPRPDYMMAAPQFLTSDTTIVGKSFLLETHP
ncbi:MAG TPA: M20/M25/M40 family metallo-hydrolase [Pyrinomonadaceae bacterium]|jgi:hypothetical protein